MYKFAALYRRTALPQAEFAFEALLSDLKTELPGFQVAFDNGQLLIVEWPDSGSQMASHRVASDGGVILGHLFTPKPDGSAQTECRRAPAVLSEHESARVVSSRGTWLRDNYWGNYVAFLCGPEDRQLTVCRSPMGQLPCFHFSMDAVSVFFSHIEMLDLLRRRGLAVDWSVAAAYLVYTGLDSELTAFRNLELILHSQRMSFDDGERTLSYFWDPVEWCLNRATDDLETIKSRMRNIAFSCASAWASIFPRILHKLSGGFDSSLVAGIMARLPNRPELYCVTVYDGSPYNDEREYARNTARRAGYTLSEIEFDPTIDDFSFYHSFPKMPWPYLVSTAWRRNEELARIARDNGVTATLAGEGGDVLFGLFRDNIAACDYFFDRGFTADMLGVAMRSARVSDTTFWEAAKKMIKREVHNPHTIAWTTRADHNWGVNVALLPKIEKTANRARWNKPGTGMALGRRLVVDSIMRYDDYFNPMPEFSFLEPIYPLLSQPLVELCLQIPTYLHQFNGRERGLARWVFADCLTDEVRLRQFKSNGSPLFHTMVSRHREFFMEYLLDGILAQKNMLDRAEIELVRRDPAATTPEQYVRIAQIAGVEAWARAWS